MVGSQGEDWGWRRENLRGASAPQLAGREPEKKSAAAEEARDFFLPLCFVARKERGFRAPPKRTPETGTSRGYQRGPQRWARAMAISADPRGGREPWLSARTPEMGASHGCQRGPQRRAGDARAAAATTKKPVCEHRSLSTPPLLGACAARAAGLPWSWDNFPGRTHGAPQAAATSRRPLPPQACPTSVPLPPPGLSEPEPTKQLLL